MARYEIKLRMNRVYNIELTAGNDEEAATALSSLLANDLPSLEGNYNGTFVTFNEGHDEVLGFFNKSDAQQRQQKLDSINEYVAQLDSEGQELLRNVVLGR